VHNASILSAVGACGLQLYRYGEARLRAPDGGLSKGPVKWPVLRPRITISMHQCRAPLNEC